MRHARDFHVVRVDDVLPGRAPGGGCPYARPDGTRRAGTKRGYAHVFGVSAPENQPSAEAILALAAAMKARPYASRDCDIPAGFTYLGQFIFHDITAMMPGETATSPKNSRSPALDLDSVLPGLRPADFPELSDAEGLFRIGVTTELPMPDDIPRDWRRPLIADTRNDDFLPLSQCHLLLLKFYNAVARYLGPDASCREDDWWRDVRQTWVLHFQAAVLFDYLPRIVDAATWHDVMDNGRRLVRTGSAAADGAWMPVEFAAAAGRFGHSMVRPFYHPWSDPLSWTTVTVEDFIRFSHANSLDRLEGGVSFHWSTDWRRMFDFSDAGRAGGEAPVPISAMAIDTHLAPQLHELPSRLRSDMADAVRSGRTFSLAASTMNRGRELGLASAQRALKLANRLLDTPIPAIDAEDIFDVGSGLADNQKAFPELRAATPLWFYILREAELLAGGTRLGPFGGRIVMETLHAAIDASKDSILRGDWRPVLPSRAVGRYEMTDLIEFSAGATP